MGRDYNIQEKFNISSHVNKISYIILMSMNGSLLLCKRHGYNRSYVIIMLVVHDSCRDRE